MLTFSKEIGAPSTTEKTTAARGYWGFQELTEEELKKISGAGCGGCGGEGCGGLGGDSDSDSTNNPDSSEDPGLSQNDSPQQPAESIDAVTVVASPISDPPPAENTSATDSAAVVAAVDMSMLDAIKGLVQDALRGITGFLNDVLPPQPQPNAPATGPRA